MATTKEYYDYIMEQLSGFDNISSKKMMGEYCIYYLDKVIGLICDNVFYLKPTESVLSLFPDAERGYPYEGSKTMMAIIDDIENCGLSSDIIEKIYFELPQIKPKKKK